MITFDIEGAHHAAARQNWFEGWRLFAVLTLILIGLCVWIAGMRQFEVEGVRMVIRFTARTSLLLFCLAFGAARWRGCGPTRWTRWQRRNRRSLGVTFAASHGLHAIAIVAFAAMDPAGFAAATSLASYVFGGIGYAFIIAMTATSFDRTAAAIGPRAWRILHLTGGYYLWFQFMVSFGKRIPDMPLYALFLIPLLAVMALRLIAMASARTPRSPFRPANGASLMAETLELAGAGLGHAAHAFAGIDAGDGALAHAVIQAIGVAILDPEPLRRAELVVLLRARILQRLLIGDRHPLVPLRGLGLEAIDHLGGVAVAGLVGIALRRRRGRRRCSSSQHRGRAEQDAEHARRSCRRASGRAAWR